MEEQMTWKGHTFTLLVFAGIVVLCSIFFILGTLVGRAQGLKIASNAASAVSKVDAKPAANEDRPDFTFYDSVKREQPAALQPTAPADVPPGLDPPAKSEPKSEPPPEARSKLVYLLIFVLG